MDVQTTLAFKGIDRSPALEQVIGRRIDELAHMRAGLMRVHVVVSELGRHQHQGRDDRAGDADGPARPGGTEPESHAGTGGPRLAGGGKARGPHSSSRGDARGARPAGRGRADPTEPPGESVDVVRGRVRPSGV